MTEEKFGAPSLGWLNFDNLRDKYYNLGQFKWTINSNPFHPLS